jgi:hypothetical protein
MENVVNYNTVKPIYNETIQTMLSRLYIERNNKKAVKDMYLNTYYWSQFVKFCEMNWERDYKSIKEDLSISLTDKKSMLEELETRLNNLNENPYVLDGVNIKKNPLRTNEEISFTYYAPKKDDE